MTDGDLQSYYESRYQRYLAKFSKYFKHSYHIYIENNDE